MGLDPTSATGVTIGLSSHAAATSIRPGFLDHKPVRFQQRRQGVEGAVGPPTKLRGMFASFVAPLTP